MVVPGLPINNAQEAHISLLLARCKEDYVFAAQYMPLMEAFLHDEAGNPIGSLAVRMSHNLSPNLTCYAIEQAETCRSSLRAKLWQRQSN